MTRLCLACNRPVKHTGGANLCLPCIKSGVCYVPTGEEYERLKKEAFEKHLEHLRNLSGKTHPPDSKLSGGGISSIRHNGKLIRR